MRFSGYTAFVPAEGFIAGMEIPCGGVHFMAVEAALQTAASSFPRRDVRRRSLHLVKAVVSFRKPFIVREVDPVINWESFSQRAETKGYDAIMYRTKKTVRESDCVVIWDVLQVSVVDPNRHILIN